MSLMEIRAKCRRLKQRHELKLVVVDYLQLMSSGKRVESRQQEVSEFSRALKLLAKELEVPVIAISPAQPWPGAAHRQEAADVRPARVGLPHRATRGSCGPTPVPRSTLGELLASGEPRHPGLVPGRQPPIRARGTMTHVFSDRA